MVVTVAGTVCVEVRSVKVCVVVSVEVGSVFVTLTDVAGRVMVSVISGRVTDSVKVTVLVAVKVSVIVVEGSVIDTVTVDSGSK